jgi:gas vesicle protein
LEDDMRYDEEQQGNRLALAAVTGALVGAGVALLFAPKPGTALRGEISGSIESLQGSLSQRYTGLVARGSALVERVNGTAGRAVAAIEQGARHYARAVGELRPRAVSSVDGRARGL